MRTVYPTLLLLLALPASAAAQQRDFTAFADSVAKIRNIAALRELDAASVASARDGSWIEAGLIRLRLHELTDDARDLERARAAFEEAERRDPSSAWAAYGTGVCLVRGPEIQIPSPGGILDDVVLAQSLAEVFGLDPRSRARRAFRRALELDPGHAGAAIELGRLALDSRVPDDLAEARDAVRTAAAYHPGDPDLLLALADLEAALGNQEASAAAAQEAVEAGADAAGTYAYALALLRTPGREAAGARAYLDAVEALTPAAAARFYEDLLPIVTDDEDLRWQTANLERRRAWLRAFWEERAALAGKTVAERIAEHYRRLAVAHERYRSSGKRGAAPGDALLREPAEDRVLPFDDRGIVYVRHGEPDHVIQTTHAGLHANETWIYTNPDGTSQSFHFVRLPNAPDFRLVSDLFAALNREELDAAIALIQDRAPYDESLHGILAKLRRVRDARIEDPGAAVADLRMERLEASAENRTATLAALERDTDRPRFDRDLPFYFDLYTFRGAAGKTEVTAAIAIPGELLEPVTSGGETLYSVDVSLIVLDTAAGTISRVDTTYNYRSPDRLAKGEHLRTHVRLEAPPSDSAVYRISVRNAADRSQGHLYGGTLGVTDYRGGELMLSDIVLAEPDSGTWHRGAARLALVPPRQFPAGEEVTLFYEIYDLPAGSPYEVEIVVEGGERSGIIPWLGRLLGFRRGRIRLRFQGEARTDDLGRVQEIRRVASELPPGSYRIRVTVTDLSTGATATREKRFVFLD